MTERDTIDVDEADELRALAAEFRAHLQWRHRGGAYAVSGQPIALAPGLASADADDPPRESLDDICADLGDCQRCKLAGGRTNIVFGVGDPRAPLMFVGEGPGAEEDRQGEPFVGPAGQLLDRMIAAMGWTRDQVYIANVVKCRPPNNRDPEPDEVDACEPFLARQIAAVQPLIIVTLGRPATHLLLRTRAPISRLRGHFQQYNGIRVMPTYHPAYLLRSPDKKRESWSDLKQVIRELEVLGVNSPRPPRD
jgi:uracil-DNA glycosylase